MNTGGTIVSAENVEATLGALPGVEAVAVVGLPHSVLGEIVSAVVQLAPGGNIDRIRTLARGALAPAALPRRWIVRESLPHTPSGRSGARRFAIPYVRSTHRDRSTRPRSRRGATLPDRQCGTRTVDADGVRPGRARAGRRRPAGRPSRTGRRRRPRQLSRPRWRHRPRPRTAGGTSGSAAYPA